MKSEMENKDWLNDYSALKQVDPGNPFTVPVGYFDDLGNRIVSYKNLTELKDKGIEGGFTVPPNYFDELTANIQSRINIESAVNTEDAGFTVPEGYFDNLEEQIQSRIFVEETLNEQPEGFTVPDGYFNTLSKNILDKTVNQDTTRNKGGVVKKLFTSTAFKYATAACFALAIGGGILINELSNPVSEHQNSFLHKQLSNVPIDDIKAYLQLNVDAGDTQQNVASDGVAVDDNSLKSALQNDVDSIQ